MLATARTFALLGVEARDVLVEVDLRRGLAAFSLVGLPDASVRESRERVRAALVNSGFDFPLRRITVNLAPADLRKAGPAFDLAIAAALLVASGQLPAAALEGVAMAGELALDGTIRPIAGALAMAEAAVRAGAGAIIVPTANAPEGALAAGVRSIPLARLDELLLLGGEREPPPAEPPQLDPGVNGARSAAPADIADLRGQPGLRRALEVAAAGGHSMLLVGPPGAGKSLAARRLPSIMPALSTSEAIDVLRVSGACGRPAPPAGERPFRAPHHTISPAGLVGGGSPLRAGEATLAHGGILFLDELGEFGREALEALRQPLEDRRVLIARARYAIELPARFMLIAAANPCPCGRGEESPECACPPAGLRRYRARLGGALADRIDLVIAVEQPSADDMGGPSGETSGAVRERVIVARERQERRLGPGICNADTTPAQARRHARLDAAAGRALAEGHRRLGLSGRGHDRVLRIARTIADLQGTERVSDEHVIAAIGLRRREAG